MIFDAFDEGISHGGMRIKNETIILICYIMKSLKKPMNRETVLESLQKDGLANYFEASACFDDLVKNKNIVATEDGKYTLSPGGNMIATQLEDNLALTVKEKAVHCALMLIEQEKLDKENLVEIIKCENGYNVKCTISGGDMNLFSFEIYVPDYNQAKLVKKNFRKNPELIYKTMLSVLTKQKDLVEETLSDISLLS